VLAFALQVYINPVDFPWQIPLLLIALAGWLLGGPWLLKLALSRQGLLGKFKFPNLMLHMLLAGLAGGAVGAAVFFLIIAIGQAGNATLTIPAAIAALPAALVTAYLILYAMLDLPLAKAMSAGTLPLVAVIALGAAMIVACALPADAARQEERNQALCRKQLTAINGQIVGVKMLSGQVPPSLEYLLEKGALAPKDLLCPSCPGLKIAYFYFPPQKIDTQTARSRETSFELRLCDFADNHKRTGRNILTSDGQAQWIKEPDFQALLTKPENIAFAKALAEAEKK
jgi:hypothetical protein